MQAPEVLVHELSTQLRALQACVSDAGQAGESNPEMAHILCTLFEGWAGRPALMTRLAAPGCRMTLGGPEARAVDWRTWWNADPMYLTANGAITRSDIASGAANSYGGFRFETVQSATGEAEVIGLHAVVEAQAWPCSPEQWEAVGRIAREVLGSSELSALLR